MMISLIVAMDRHGVIGADGKLPWHLPTDLKHFRRVTMGKPVVMGRRTHESIGRALPGRENIVLTRDPAYTAAGCTVLHGIEAVLEHCRDAAEVIVMGGTDIYAAFLPLAERVYLTEIDAAVTGDAFFPDLVGLRGPQWRELESTRIPAGGDEQYPLRFSVRERARPF
jgi:dihydrofolate reductase